MPRDWVSGQQNQFMVLKAPLRHVCADLIFLLPGEARFTTYDSRSIHRPRCTSVCVRMCLHTCVILMDYSYNCYSHEKETLRSEFAKPQFPC